MKELYEWVPWFNELCVKIAAGGKEELARKAHQIEWRDSGQIHPILEYGDENVDPFSFIYTTASVFGGTLASRKRIHDSINEVFDLSTTLPIGEPDAFIFPQGIPRNTLFHNGNEFAPDLLWRVFRKTLNDGRELDSDDFNGALNIGSVAMRKLTQTLFLINPTTYLPIDGITALVSGVRNTSVKDWNDYQSVLEAVRGMFPGCELYEVNVFAWLLKDKVFPVGSKTWQISANVYADKVDRWDDFVTENAVWTGGPKSGISWEQFNPIEQIDLAYPLSEPEPGDQVLVRLHGHGHGIGIVHKNDYAQEISAESRLHVVWLNRTHVQDLLNSSLQRGFSRAVAIESQFLQHDEYRATADLLARLRESQDAHDPQPDAAAVIPKPKEQLHPLNQIIYGPPGTGKTYSTVRLALSIVDSDRDAKHDMARFEELQFDAGDETGEEPGNIAFVTFHQNFAYEDFVEGIQPVLETDELRYKNQPGVFRNIVRAAVKRPNENFVLIIDEINRGNIAKIFGELITLIEESRRLGKPDATHVTLALSKERFAVPSNLYLIGTMNTADRSIQHLDTALRRRFTFLELMPDPENNDIPANLDGVDCRKLLAVLNERIALLTDREHQIGHTYLMGLKTVEQLAHTFRDRIFPLLQEYFFDDWAKIRAVLANNAFVEERKPKVSFSMEDVEDDNLKIFHRLSDEDAKWRSAAEYQAIYQRERDSNDQP